MGDADHVVKPTCWKSTLRPLPVSGREMPLLQAGNRRALAMSKNMKSGNITGSNGTQLL